MAGPAERYVPAHVQDAVAAARAEERVWRAAYRALPTYDRLWLRLTAPEAEYRGRPWQRPVLSAQTLAVLAAAAALASAFATDSLTVALLVLVLTPLALAVLQRSAYACALALYTFLTDTRRMTRWVIRAQRCRSSCACVLCARWCGRCADCCCTPAARGIPNRLRSGV